MRTITDHVDPCKFAAHASRPLKRALWRDSPGRNPKLCEISHCFIPALGYKIMP